MKKLKILLIFIVVIMSVTLFSGCFGSNKGKTYIVTFVSNGGSQAESVIFGEKSVKLPQPEKEGYIFDGWFFDDITFQSKLRSDSLISSDTKVYAKWTIKKYDIIFNTGGGSVVKSLQQDYNTKITRPDDPVKDEAIFDGWYSDAEFQNAYDFNSAITSNFTVYAKWNINYTAGLLFTPINYYEEYSVSKGALSENTTSIIIPATYNKKPVTTIDNNGFENLTALMTVEFSENITTIGNNTFKNCSSLTDISLHNVTSIGISAFQNCTALINIFVPETVIEIKDCAFSGCSELSVITLSNGLKTIGEAAFLNCPLLREVNIPLGVTAIGRRAFTGSANLESISVNEENANYKADSGILYDISGSTIILYPALKSEDYFTIPESVTTVGEYAFYGAEGLNSLTISEGVQNIGTFAFYNCSSLTEIIIPESVTGIGGNVFGECGASITFAQNCQITSMNYVFKDYKGIEIVIPGSVKYLSGIDGCVNLINLTVPFAAPGNGDTFFGNFFGSSYFDGSTQVVRNNNNYYLPSSLRKVIVTGGSEIKNQAFYNCLMLNEIILPDSVASIKEEAFYGCTNLAVIDIPYSVVDATQNAFSGTKWYDNKADGLIYVGRALYSYKGEMAENTVLENIKPDTVSFTDGVFYGREKLVKIVIPENVTNLGDYTFYGCTGLTEIEIPDTVTDIGSYAFSDCASQVTFGSSLITAIRQFTFAGYKGTSLTIPANVITIEAEAFNNCTANIAFDENSAIKTLINNAFKDYKGTVVTLPDSFTSIEGGAFFGCSALQEITLPLCGKNLGEIFGTIEYDGATATLQGGKEYYIPDTLTTVAVNAGDLRIYAPFYNCNKLTEVSFREGVTGLGNNMFYGCTLLESVAAPSSATFIGDNAFYGCESLAEMIFPSSIKRIGDSAFYGCINLAELFLPEGLEIVGDYAFYNCFLLPDITIPSTLYSIGGEVFSGCTKNVNFAEGINITAIGAAFKNYKGKYLTVPECVEEITEGAFNGCSDLINITLPFIGKSLDSTLEMAVLGYAFGNLAFTNSTYVSQYYTEGNTDTNSFCLPSSLRSVTITGGTILNYGAFSNCEMLTSIIVPSELTEINGYSFYNCNKLTGINIPLSVTNIGKRAFHGCISLTNLIIPSSVKSIGDYAFENCEKVSALTFEDGEDSLTIGERAFENCNSVSFTVLTLPSRVTSIGDYAFRNCNSLVTVYIERPSNPSGITAAGEYIFNNNQYLTNIYVPDAASVTAYKTSQNWNVYQNKISEKP